MKSTYNLILSFVGVYYILQKSQCSCRMYGNKDPALFFNGCSDPARFGRISYIMFSIKTQLVGKSSLEKYGFSMFILDSTYFSADDRVGVLNFDVAIFYIEVRYCLKVTPTS